MLHLVIKVNEEGGGSGAGGGGRRVKQTLIVFFFIPHLLFTTFKIRYIYINIYNLCFMYIYLTKSRGSFSFSIAAL